MLGFTDEEMVLIRLTMAAWMLCTNDHSLYEIMLGAAPYMPVCVLPHYHVDVPVRVLACWRYAGMYRHARLHTRTVRSLRGISTNLTTPFAAVNAGNRADSAGSGRPWTHDAC